MLIKVLFTDGSQGMIRTARLVEFIRMSEIAAYKPFEDWIELRRKRNDGYMGPERRFKTLH
jgi:hypothetical protein